MEAERSGGVGDALGAAPDLGYRSKKGNAKRTAGFGVCPAGLELLLFSKIGKAEERRTLGKTE